MKTNEKKLIEVLLECKPGHPFANAKFAVDHLGKPFQLPSIGGITLNLQVGDSAFGWVGDHIEPGVSCRWKGDKPMENPNQALQLLSCAGNTAKILSGKAKGAKGVVIGAHGGSEHIIIDFDRKTKEKMTYEDKIAVKAVGMGLKFDDYPDISIVNLAPSLLKKMKIKKNPKNGKLRVPVTTLVPSECMGSGIGSIQVATGDYDIMTSDAKYNKKYGFENIRFGDFVALLDQDNRYGRAHRTGAVTIGIIVHSDCKNSGHGPGVTTLLTCSKGIIEPVIDPKANIADLLSIGTFKKKAKAKKK
ncbi:MAG: DUF4438 domain-containing protein [Proteobacteria bacterium]|nr:DUF4438 domain-containing protein [Pseudomonadota bacterium]